MGHQPVLGAPASELGRVGGGGRQPREEQRVVGLSRSLLRVARGGLLLVDDPEPREHRVDEDGGDEHLMWAVCAMRGQGVGRV